jgi:hypothetical protein
VDEFEEPEENINLDETCSICLMPVPDYKPRYSNGLFWNYACSDCKNSSEDYENDETPG